MWALSNYLFSCFNICFFSVYLVSKCSWLILAFHALILDLVCFIASGFFYLITHVLRSDICFSLCLFSVWVMSADQLCSIFILFLFLCPSVGGCCQLTSYISYPEICPAFCVF
jgi:hypothetical protein